MEKQIGDKYFCDKCDNEINASDEFCVNCGEIFLDNVFCSIHLQKEATGVCVICCQPYCDECGEILNNIFLCADHAGYEIYQNMARIFGTNDDSIAIYAKQCLEQEGLHPFIYKRKASPISVGGPSYHLFRASGEFDGHIINEIKLMVPCQEVVQAEDILKKLELV